MSTAGHDGKLGAQENALPLAETWAAIGGTQTTLRQLWVALFNQLAAEAGLPCPQVQLGIAAFSKKAHADALAAHVRAALGVEAARFKVNSAAFGLQHCVSIN